MSTYLVIGAVLVIGAALVIFIYGVSLYNSLVNVKNAVDKAWANIDVLLKQRHDELPKLVEVCLQYKQFEQATLQQVISARSRVQDAGARGDIAALGLAEGALRGGLGQLFAVAEAYSELKTNENFMQLQTRISGLENAIADRRYFVISNWSEDHLTRKYRLWTWVHLVIFFGSLAGLGWLMVAPFPTVHDAVNAVFDLVLPG